MTEETSRVRLVQEKKREAKEKAQAEVSQTVTHFSFNSSSEQVKTSYRQAERVWNTLQEAQKQKNYEDMLVNCYIYEKIVSKGKLDTRQEATFLNEMRTVKKNFRLLKKKKNAAISGLTKDIKRSQSINQSYSKSTFRSRKLSGSRNRRKTSKDVDSSIVKLKTMESNNPMQHFEKKILLNGNFEELDSLDYYIKPISGDGHCAFRAVAQGMKRGNLSKAQEDIKAMELRKLACYELRRHKDRNIREMGMTLQELVMMSVPEDRIAEGFDGYVKRMEGTGYGGEIEFILLSRAKGIPIYIYVREHNEVVYKRISKYQQREINYHPVLLLWHRGQSTSGNHYNLLLKYRTDDYVL